ncbi:MAG: hypothetical protein IPK85_22460 [Gemmatimonadetes bacterium]|nr:hypothetical protein [Gemmatimonadota bacterium]
MSRRHQHLVAFALFTTLACARSDVVSRQPNLAAGGRAVAIAVKPDDDQRLVVASETGGLFRSFDAGASWLQVPGFPSHFLHDVTFAALGPEILIATTRSRFRAVNDGGIWRSTDGGASWTQPAGALPPPSRNCPARPSAYAISFLPLTRTVYVATDCGLSKSTDNGVTWTNEQLDPAATFKSDSLQHRVWSVSVLTRTSGVAAADGNRGLFFLDGNGPGNARPRGRSAGFHGPCTRSPSHRGAPITGSTSAAMRRPPRWSRALDVGRSRRQLDRTGRTEPGGTRVIHSRRPPGLQ